MITQKDIDAQGNVVLWEKHEDGTRQVKLTATDAIHAMQADPKRWSLNEPVAPAPKPEPAPAPVKTSTSAPNPFPSTSSVL